MRKRLRRVDQFVAEVHRQFALTLIGAWDADAAWKAISWLHRHGNRFVFERAAQWCHSASKVKRGRGAAVVSQLRRYSRVSRNSSELLFSEESAALLMNVLAHEQEGNVLYACLAGLGHLRRLEGLPMLLRYCDNASPDVRFHVAVSLGYFSSDIRALDALQVLMEDEDGEVRDWAIFGAGVQGDMDSEELRAAFLAHIEDAHFNARLEAICSLAQRHDLRVVVPLISMLKRYGSVNALIEAASSLIAKNESQVDWYSREWITALQNAFPEQATIEALSGLSASRR